MAVDVQKVGQKFVVIGDSLVDTGSKLGDQATKIRAVAVVLGKDDVRKSLERIETGIRSVRALIVPVVSALQAIAKGLRDVAVPSIDPTFTSIDFAMIGKVRFVTGLTTSVKHPLAGKARATGRSTGRRCRHRLPRSDQGGARVRVHDRADTYSALGDHWIKIANNAPIATTPAGTL